jgi:hypothetical protein
MRRLGVLAAVLAAALAVGAGFGGLSERASAAGAPVAGVGIAGVSIAPGKRLPQNLTLSLIMSRGHELMTVLIRNRGPGMVCIDPNFGATARLSAFAHNGRSIPSMNPTQGRPLVECARLPVGRTVHVVYDLRALYPLGLPGDSRLCYASWWKPGVAGSKATMMTTTRCLHLPEAGIGRR